MVCYDRTIFGNFGNIQPFENLESEGAKKIKYTGLCNRADLWRKNGTLRVMLVYYMK